VKHVSDAGSALSTLHRERYDVIFISIDLLPSTENHENIESVFNPFKAIYPTIEIVVIGTPAAVRSVVELVKAGASDYLTSPVTPEEAQLVVETIEKRVLRQSELDYLRSEFWGEDAQELVRTENARMREVFQKIRSVAPTRSTVMLTGETGTGKGVLAQLIHRHSLRRSNQFISLHCGAVPETLLESELFGHEKGAFTGAVRKKLGKFEIAAGGTIFLDEIGTITPSAQIKLLQVLQDGTFSRVGSEEATHTDARVIAATNADLKAMCDRGEFRKDLFYRLNVFPIDIPPLRDRLEDLPAIADAILRRLEAEYQKGITGLQIQVLDALRGYSWPGNIRELENLLERAYILEAGGELTPGSFPLEVMQSAAPRASVSVRTGMPLGKARHLAVEDFERQYLKELMAGHSGTINLSAEAAGISTRQLHKLLTRYGIRKADYKK
jgi:DNA-binding NtrC family response regulator